MLVGLPLPLSYRYGPAARPCGLKLGGGAGTRWPADADNARMSSTPAQPRNPLHGLTLEAVLTELVAAYGWPGLGERIPLRCFTHDPSVASSLKFLRRTPWARDKVESLYLFMRREQRRSSPAQ